MKTALVTGASGFIGLPLCLALANRGVNVVALARRPQPGPWKKFVCCDLSTGPLPDGIFEGVDSVFHLAARSHYTEDSDRDRTAYIQLNVDGTRMLLRAARSSNVERFIFFSSVKAVGEGGEEMLDESVAPRPETSYGESKLEAEKLIFETAAKSRFSATVLRLPLVYGAGVGGNLRDMIEAVARHRFPPIAECGNRRAMVHVRDVVAASLLAVESPVASGKTYHVTDGREYSTREIYDAIRKALGKPPLAWSTPVIVLRAAAAVGDVMRSAGLRAPIDSARLEKLIGSARYDGRRIREELGFRPAENFESALPEMIAADANPAGPRRAGAEG